MTAEELDKRVSDVCDAYIDTCVGALRTFGKEMEDVVRPLLAEDSSIPHRLVEAIVAIGTTRMSERMSAGIKAVQDELDDTFKDIIP